MVGVDPDQFLNGTDLKLWEMATYPFVDFSWGYFFYLFIFFMIFTGLYIKQRSVVIPSLLGLIYSALWYTYLPPESYWYMAVLLILSLSGIVYTIARR